MVHSDDARALILMLNAIRLQLLAAQVHNASEECLASSALMAGEALELMGLLDKPAKP